MSVESIRISSQFSTVEAQFLVNFSGISYSEGDVLYIDSNGDVVNLGIGTNGQVLTVNAGATAPEWTTSGAGDVTKVGTPVDNQIGVWTGDGTIEGTTGLTYDGSNLKLTGDIGSTGTRITKGWFTDLQVTNAISGSITGNAGTATALATARTIAGVSFDGTANISLNNNAITNGAGYTTNTGDMILASVQTVTGAKTFGSVGAVGKLIIAGNTSGTTILNATATAGSGTVTLPTSGTLYSTGTTDVSVADGGTGRSTGTTAYALIATGTTATGVQQSLAQGTTAQILVGGGAALPVWTTATGTGAPVRATSPVLVTPALGTPASGVMTNVTGIPVGALANGTDGELITWDSSGVAAKVPVGTATHVLTSNGAGAVPTFQAAAGGGGKPETFRITSVGTPFDMLYMDDMYRFGYVSSRFLQLEKAGQMPKKRDAASDFTGVDTLSRGAVIIGAYAYVLMMENSTDPDTWEVYRYSVSDISAGGTIMTWSGATVRANTNTIFRMTSDGTNFYFSHQAGNSANDYSIAKFTVSGTVFTYDSTITCGSTSGLFDRFLVNSTGDIYAVNTTGNLTDINKYNSSGTLQTTASGISISTDRFLNYGDDFYISQGTPYTYSKFGVS